MLEIHLELINLPTLTPSVCKKLLRPMKLSCIQIFGLFFFYFVHVFFFFTRYGDKSLPDPLKFNHEFFALVNVLLGLVTARSAN